jgi:hypothetical protein
MAYKIFKGAKPFLKADIRPFNVTEMRMLTDWVGILLAYCDK